MPAGRPRTGKAHFVSVTYKFPAALITRLAEEKARTGVPTSEFIRRAIEAALPKFAIGERVAITYGDYGTVVDFVGIGGNCFYVELDNGNRFQYQASELTKVASNDAT